MPDDFWTRLKQLAFPDPTAQVEGIRNFVPPEPTPPDNPWTRPVPVQGGKIDINDLAKNYSDAFRLGAEQFAGVDSRGPTAMPAVVPTRANYSNKYEPKFESKFRQLPLDMPAESKAGIAYQAARTERLFDQVPMEYPEHIDGGTTFGQYQHSGSTGEGSKIRVGRQRLHPEAQNDPVEVWYSEATGQPTRGVESTGKNLAHTGTHENIHANQSMNQARRARVAGNEMAAEAGFEQPFPGRAGEADRPFGNLASHDLYTALGTIAKEININDPAVRGHLDTILAPNSPYYNELYSKASPGLQNALDTITSLGYKPETFGKYLDIFKPKQGDRNFGKLHELAPAEREYSGNPMELFANQAGRTSGKGYEKFTQDFPNISGRGESFFDYITNLQRKIETEYQNKYKK